MNIAGNSLRTMLYDAIYTCIWALEAVFRVYVIGVAVLRCIQASQRQNRCPQTKTYKLHIVLNPRIMLLQKAALLNTQRPRMNLLRCSATMGS